MESIINRSELTPLIMILNDDSKGVFTESWISQNKFYITSYFNEVIIEVRKESRELIISNMHFQEEGNKRAALNFLIKYADMNGYKKVVLEANTFSKDISILAKQNNTLKLEQTYLAQV